MAGLGISDAVRNSILDWMTPEIVGQLKNKIPGADSWTSGRLRTTTNWSRKARRKIATGFERDYICTGIQPLGLVTLCVHTDIKDKYIKYISFRVDNKVVAGGFVNVPSVLISQAGRDRTIKDLEFAKETSVNKFVQFTAKQIKEIQDNLEWSNSLKFEERDF